MKQLPTTAARTDSSKPAESHQTPPVTTPTEAGTKLTPTQRPPNNPSPPSPLEDLTFDDSTLEELRDDLEITSLSLTRKSLIDMEIQYLDSLLVDLKARQADPNYDAPEPPERELSPYDEDEFQLLAYSGIKMCHPAMVHPARTELATRIYEELYRVYRQGDLDALWDFLSSSHAQLKAIPAPPPGEGEERACIETTLQKIRKVKY
jgi:hypothetical protein